ncbi:A/G-specific adenine glycosylase [Moraxella nasibovis]|uniref:A/G-specific adenine glycosylase n=1 Tax=Moraxella nasibovis TaxID=2904120 RepID=UPI00240E9E1D|nr:A/G-specific adenine glycosylase [Moraxella nasibovis]WFF38940.1 A/G-specific adenine glycosylase [Moraxella nasibovis]
MNHTTPNHANNHATFAPRLLTWFATHGRHDLPWQYHHADTSDIYAVWLSEIMLQQTQVATVLGYFEKFIKKFPTVQDLANANWDEVASLWAGLGYYARARNLHAGAKQVADFIEKNGEFPQSVDDWQAIKGVGRSTAGAIVAMGVRSYGVICDGNVKRVLTRWAGIDGDITKSATDKVLWALADTLTPTDESGKFAQAMMDLGATLCTRTRPDCQACPLSADCTAHRQGNPTAYPVKAKKTAKPHRHSLVFAVRHGERLLWIKRQSDGGIWDGLYALPMLMIADESGDMARLPHDLTHAKTAHERTKKPQSPSLAERQVLDILPNLPLKASKTIKHTLTHFHWHLSLVELDIDDDLYRQISHALTAVHAEFYWQKDAQDLGIPKAMIKLGI